MKKLSVKEVVSSCCGVGIYKSPLGYQDRCYACKRECNPTPLPSKTRDSGKDIIADTFDRATNRIKELVKNRDSVKEVEGWEKGPYGDIAKLKDPLEMFDLCIAGSFMAGQLGGKIPVDETRKVFEKILAQAREERDRQWKQELTKGMEDLLASEGEEV